MIYSRNYNSTCVKKYIAITRKHWIKICNSRASFFPWYLIFRVNILCACYWIVENPIDSYERREYCWKFNWKVDLFPSQAKAKQRWNKVTLSARRNLRCSNYFYLRDSGVASKFMRTSARIHGVVSKDIRSSFHASHGDGRLTRYYESGNLLE